jgi:hypothetical protein
MNIRVFKLINGEELLAEVFSQHDKSFELKNPAQIVLQQTDKGVGVALAPYMPYVEGHVILGRHAVASDGTPNQQLVNEYNRIFGSGIVVAPASALAGLVT